MRGQLRFWGDIVGFGLYCGVLGYAIAESRWSFTFIALGPLLVGLYRMWERYAPDAAERAELKERRRQAERQYEQREQSRPPSA